jgi:Fe-S-cluster containining protein
MKTEIEAEQDTIMRCLRCGVCCRETEMLLSTEDIERLEKKGYRKDSFVVFDKEGYPKLRNLQNHCFFFNVDNQRCTVYHYRPMGCHLYPVIYDSARGLRCINELKQYVPTVGTKVSLRHCYYYLFSKGLIKPTKTDYQNLSRWLEWAKRKLLIPWDWITDTSRERYLLPFSDERARNVGSANHGFPVFDLEGFSESLGKHGRGYSLRCFRTLGSG